MSENSSHLETIFFNALNIQDAAARSEYLAQACGQDEALLQKVEQMLSVQSKVGSFLEQSPAAYAGTVNLENKILEAGLSAGFTQGEAIVVGSANHSVLRSLGMTLGEVPRVLLREPKEAGKDPIVRPRSNEVPSDASDSRYQLAGEIARGGMGAIIKGRDVDLGRDLAIKVLLDAHKDKPEVVQRFIEEAQIGGQLQHPGIVPVYELGQFGDQRPFFSMKLVKGETLAGLLSARKSPTEDRAKYLGIFEHVCQTMAYAHSRGVIHRDLKPANIMVGAFGEVQVMDWGLAKVLSAGGIADEKKSLAKQAAVSVIQTRRSTGSESPGSSGSQTEMGSVMGTPAYMSPEQALGEVDRLDERTDVFGLAAILCEILTGKPPYVASNGEQVFRLASRGKLEDCFARLDACQVDTELKKIVLDGLALEPDDRLRDAGQLASRVSAYLESVETRLRKAEVDRATESARAEEALKTAAQELVSRKEAQGRIIEERKRRRVTMALAASLMIGLMGTIWQAFRASQSERVARANEMVALESEKKAIVERDAKEKALEKEAEQRNIALVAQQHAQQERDAAKLAREDLRKSLYAASMNLIPIAWEADNVRRVRELLGEQIPKPGEEDLRHFEWNYWYRQSHGASRSWKLGTGPENYVIGEDGTKIVGWAYIDELSSAVDSSNAGNRVMRIRVLEIATQRELYSLNIGAQELFSKDLVQDSSRLGVSHLSVNRDASRIAVLFSLSTPPVQVPGAEVSTLFPPGGRRSTLNYQTVVFDTQTNATVFEKSLDSRRTAISSDGKRLLTCEIDGPLDRANAKFKIWDLDHPGNEPISLTANHEVGAIPTINPKFSADGSRLVMETRHFGDALRSVTSLSIWDAVTGELQVNQPLEGDSLERAGNILDVSFSPDSHTLATVEFPPPRRDLFSRGGTREITVRLWECKKSNELKPVQTKGAISLGNGVLPQDYYIKFSPSGEQLIVWTKRENVGSLIDIATGTIVQRIKTASNQYSIAFSNDSRQVITVTGDDAPEGTSTRLGRISNAIVEAWDVALSEESPRIASIGSSRERFFWSPDKDRRASFVSGLADGQAPSEGPPDSTILLSDSQGNEILRFKEHNFPVAFLSFSPDGKWIISSGGQGSSLLETILWETSTGTVRWSNTIQTKDTNQASSPSAPIGAIINRVSDPFSPDGKWLALPADQGQRIVSSSDLKEYLLVDNLQGRVFFSPDSRKLVSLHPRIDAQSNSNEVYQTDLELKIWDIESGQVLASHIVGSTTSGRLGRIASSNRIVFSPDGRFCTPLAFSPGLSSIASPSSIAIYDLRTGGEFVRLEVSKEHGDGKSTNPSGMNRSLAFSPKGDRLMIVDARLAGMNDKRRFVGIWELPSGKFLYRLEAHAFTFDAPTFSPDGKRIAAASTLPGQVAIWDSATGRQLLTLTTKEEFRSARSLSFSPDGNRLTLQHVLVSPVNRSMLEGEIVWDVTPKDLPQ